MIRLRTNRINNEIVKPIYNTGVKHNKHKGYNLFEDKYANIFICAKKKSGKTSVIFNIVKKMVNKNTIVVIFASTVYKDNNWREIVKWLRKHNIEHIIETSTIDKLNDIVISIQEDIQHDDNEDKESISAENIQCVCKFPISDNIDEDNNSSNSIDYIFIFDNIGQELRSKTISTLLKKNRHLHITNIISSQYWNDIDKQGRLQLDYVLLFRNHPEDKLREIYRDLDISISLNMFLNIYNEVHGGQKK